MEGVRLGRTNARAPTELRLGGRTSIGLNRHDPMRPRSATALTDARARTFGVLADLDDRQLWAQPSPLMSPLVWDLAHIAHYEELWLIRELGVGEATDPRFDDIYDAFAHPRAERPALDLLDPEAARAFGAAVRERVWWSEVATDSNARISDLVRPRLRVTCR